MIIFVRFYKGGDVMACKSSKSKSSKGGCKSKDKGGRKG